MRAFRGDKDRKKSYVPVRLPKEEKRKSVIARNAKMVDFLMERAGTVRYMSNIPSLQGVSLTSLELRDILHWHLAIEKMMAQYPGCPFPWSTTIAQHVAMHLMTDNDVDGFAEFHSVPFSVLISYIQNSIRPVDKITFLSVLNRAVYFKSKQDFQLTERNFYDFFENLKLFVKEFAFCYNFLCDSLREGDEKPPLIMKTDVGVLYFFITKIPCYYGFAVWADMNGDRRFDNIEDFVKKFMDVALVHRSWSENTRKMHNIVSFRPSKGGKQSADNSFRPEEKRKSFSQKRLSMVFQEEARR